MWVIIKTIVWPIAKLVIFVMLLVYLWSLVTEECKCAEGMRAAAPIEGFAQRPEHYKAFRSIAAF